MPWNSLRYPVSMRNLDPAVREKAIEIANALLRRGVSEGKAIRIAIASAKRWTDAANIADANADGSAHERELRVGGRSTFT